MNTHLVLLHFRRGLVFFGAEVRCFLAVLADFLYFLSVVMAGFLTLYGTLVLIVLSSSTRLQYALRGDWVLPGAALYFAANMLVVFVRHVIRLGETDGRSSSLNRRPLDYF
jgi:hypothetical protein